MSDLKTSLGRIVKLEQGDAPDRSAKGWKVEGAKEKSHQGRECSRLREEFEVWRFHRTQKVVEHRHEENVGRQGSNAKGGRVIWSGNTKPCTRRNFLSGWLSEDIAG